MEPAAVDSASQPAVVPAALEVAVAEVVLQLARAAEPEAWPQVEVAAALEEEVAAVAQPLA